VRAMLTSLSHHEDGLCVGRGKGGVHRGGGGGEGFWGCGKNCGGL